MVKIKEHLFAINIITDKSPIICIRIEENNRIYIIHQISKTTLYQVNLFRQYGYPMHDEKFYNGKSISEDVKNAHLQSLYKKIFGL